MKKSWSKIWTEIAVAYDTPPSKMSIKQKCIADLGLCHAMRYMGKWFNIPQELVLHRPGFWWAQDKKGYSYRATFAGLMAAMGNKGFADFLKWCEGNKEAT